MVSFLLNIEDSERNISNMHKGGGRGQPPLVVIRGTVTTFVSHSGEMSLSPTPYTTSDQTPFGELKKPAPRACTPTLSMCCAFYDDYQINMIYHKSRPNKLEFYRYFRKWTSFTFMKK